MADSKSAFRKQFNEIRARFLESSLAKLAELTQYWCAPPAGEADTLDTLLRLTHNFTGAGASFGLEVFSERARRLEYYVRALIDGGGALTDTQRHAVCDMLRRLSACLEQPTGSSARAEAVVADGSGRSAGDERNRRVFLVEDDPQQASELSLQLGFLGYEVHGFDTPEAACAALPTLQPAVILMDIVFPRGPLAGPETLTRTGLPPGVPVVFLSVRNDFESRLAALRAGGHHYLTKPVDMRKLAEILGDLTAGRIQGACRVLLVDDEPGEAELHALMLEQAGMVTSTVHHPGEALEALERFQPDLILMDLYMPDCDGAELAALLRRHEHFAATPIIFLSSEERFEKKVDAMRLGGEDFLTKPVGRNELTAMVELRAGRARQMRALYAELGTLLRDYDNQKRALDLHLPMMLTDLQGRVTYANDRMLSLMGTTLIGFLGSDFKKPPYRKAFPDALWHELERGGVWQGTVRGTHAAGGAYRLHLTTVPARDEAGRVYAFFWMGTDLTAHHQEKETLRAAAVTAETALRNKRDLLACTSHEMRSTLNGIAGMAQLLAQTPLSQDQTHFVDNINTGAAHLVGVINQTLDFSKIEAGKLVLEQVPFDLRTCMEDVGDLIAPQAAEKCLELALQMHPDVPETVIGDALRLRQVLINLLSNAVKFTETGQVLLKLYVRKRLDEGMVLQFEVVDTGIGIPAHHRHLLFRFFSQTEASTARRFGGSGLGLAISSRLVQAMGGTLDVASQEGVGSRFFFDITLPTVKEAAPSMGALSGLRVLVVCALEATTIGLAQHLEYFGCRFSMVKHADQAWGSLSGYAAERPFDAVLYLLRDRERAAAFAAQMQARYPGILLLLLAPLSAAATIDTRLKQAFRSIVPMPVRRKNLLAALQAGMGAAAAGPQAEDSAVAHLHAARGERVILVVEDNPVNRRLTRNVLEGGGYQCLLAEDGQVCLDLLAAGTHVDLVLMDRYMPALDGPATLTRIRAGGYGPQDLPVVAMTGAEYHEDDRPRFDGHLLKPVTPAALFHTLDTLLSLSTEGSPVGPAPNIGFAAAVDLGRFNLLTQHDAALGRSLVDMFQLSMSRELLRLESALRARDGAAVLQLAHGIKGAALEIGARDLGRIAGRLEHAAETGDFTRTPALVASLRSEYGRVETYLNSTLAQEGDT